MNLTNHPDLLPCPFCGGEPTLIDPDDGCYCVSCSECQYELMGGLVGIGWWPTVSDAAAVWNRRAAPRDVPAAVPIAQALAIVEKVSIFNGELVADDLRKVGDTLRACETALRTYARDKWSPVTNYSDRHWYMTGEPWAAADAVLSGGVPAEGFYLAIYKQEWRGGPMLWWAPNSAGYTSDLSRAGVYTQAELSPVESEYTVPVPTWFVCDLRIRHEVDPEDRENVAFHTANKLRAAISAAKATREAT